jgi:hypothetical protein
MANKHPELQKKIILANFLAPVAYVDHMKSPIRRLAPFRDPIHVRLLILLGTLPGANPTIVN